MKIIRYCVPALMALLLAACSKDAYVPGEPDADDCYGVWFPQDDAGSTIEFKDTDATFLVEVTVCRNETDDAISVPVTVRSGGAFTCTNAEFEDGQSETTVTVDLGNMALCVDYNVLLTVDDTRYAKIYGTDDVSFEFNAVKYDYKTYATGTYQSGGFSQFGGNASWSQVLEYSETMDLYRLNDLYVEDSYITFKWDGGENVDLEGKSFAAGFSYSSYGMVYVSIVEGYNAEYTASQKRFRFPFEWSVSAGTLIAGAYDYYTVTKFAD